MSIDLRDGFGRRFTYLRLSVTDACNFRCNYCLPNGYQGKGGKTSTQLPLTLPEIQTLVTAFAAMGTRKIRLTGGEPAIRSDLLQIIEICANTPGIEEVALTTNGYNLTKNVHQWHNAGLSALNLSLDSLNRDQFKAITGMPYFDRIMEGLEKAMAINGMRVKTNAVLLRCFNLDQFESFLEFVRNRNMSARFIELMQTGNNQVFFKDNGLSGSILQQYLQNNLWEIVNRGHLAGPALEYRHRDYLGRIGLIMPYGPEFCASCNRLRISSQGKLHLCLFAEEGLDIRALARSRDVVGIIGKTRLLLEKKHATHYLHQGYTGAAENLAMLGG